MKASLNLPRRLGRAAVAGLLATALGTAGAMAAGTKPIRFERLSLEQGLSQATVLCMLQDSRGYVWLGTEDGLNRYDGYGFKVYKHDPEDPASLPSDFVWAIAESADGDLWVGTDGGGVAVLDRETDRFRQLEPQGGLSSPFIRSLAFDGEGALWIGTRDAGIDRVDLSTGDVTRLRNGAEDPASLSDDKIYALLPGSGGTMWVGTNAGVNRADVATGAVERFVHRPADRSSLSDGRVRALFEDARGDLWVGTYGGGLNRLDPDSGDFIRFRHDPDDATSLSHDRVRAIFEDADGRLWVGTSRGLNLMNDERDGFVRYSHDRGSLNSLSDDHVMSIAQDRGGVVWVGTRSGGANKFNPLTWQFGHHAADPSDPEGLTSPMVTSFSEDRAGNLWVGTFGGGLHVMDRTTGRMSRYLHNPDDSGSISSDRVMALEHDHTGALWVGTLDGGLNRFEALSGTFRSFRNDPERPDGLSANGVMSLLSDSRGTLWVGTFGGGLNRFDAERGTFTHFRHDPEDPASLGGDRVTSLVESTDGRIWVGTDGGGLALFDPRSGEFARFTRDPDSRDALRSDVVYSLFLDAAGTLWVGTRAGLSRLDRLSDDGRSAGFHTFSEKDGMPNDVVYGIRADHSGSLWLSTNRGLSRFESTSGTFTNFDASHGLQANEFNFGAAFRSTSGELFFGGVNGFNAFFPERLRRSEHVPPVVLTSFRMFHEPVVEAGPPDEIRKIDLGYRDDVVTFEFAALDFAAPDRNCYAYKLEGFDEDWIELGTVHRVTYTDLDGGRYVFRVRGASSDGVWNEDGIALPISVAAPPWKTPWAYGAYAFMFIGSVFGFVRVHQRKLEREEEYSLRLEQEVHQRTDELHQRARDLETLNTRLVEASITDALTGLANRRFLLQFLEKEVALVHRRYSELQEGRLTEESVDLAFLMIDLDDFKSINDTAGHAAGDEVLRQLKVLLEESTRSSDILIRWGGDEFLVVGRDSNPDNLETLAERIRSRIEKHVFDLGDGRVARTTCSIGFACYPFVRADLEALTWEQVVSIADRALYVAKASGRNAWVGFSSTEKTNSRGLLGAIRNQPERLANDGQVKVHDSLDGDCRLVWE